MADVLVPREPVPVAPQGRRASAWYGMIFLVATEAALFIYLLFSYFFLASQAPNHWPPSGVPDPLVAGIDTLILLASSGTAWWAQRGIQLGSSIRLAAGLCVTILLGLVFAGVQGWEWAHKTFTPATNAYGSLYFTTTGLHIAHVAIGLIILAFLAVWAAMGRFTARRHLHVVVGVLYWHFVDVVWIFVFSTFYLSPRLG
ncbi:MAG: heme-copper oxidase subunit III [Alphaproteobacteria bacterium]|nr:heme-copper oxidase subunit III [Alphaproteobacteria bacterium]